MRPNAQELLAKCLSKGVEMRPSQTVRTPLEQAKLWRQSRTRSDIVAQINRFHLDGAEFLAFCLDSVGPQSGDPVTNAPPGLSWHQWGEAMDCFWVVDGSAEWSTRRLVAGVNGYQVYAEEAKRLGLTPGGYFRSLKDWPHVQLRTDSSPLGPLTIVEIDREMKARFG